jgi:hypothetical protein
MTERFWSEAEMGVCSLQTSASERIAAIQKASFHGLWTSASGQKEPLNVDR